MSSVIHVRLGVLHLYTSVFSNRDSTAPTTEKFFLALLCLFPFADGVAWPSSSSILNSTGAVGSTFNLLPHSLRRYKLQ